MVFPAVFSRLTATGVEAEPARIATPRIRSSPLVA